MSGKLIAAAAVIIVIIAFVIVHFLKAPDAPPGKSGLGSNTSPAKSHIDPGTPREAPPSDPGTPHTKSDADAPRGTRYLRINAQGYKEYINDKDGSILILIPAGEFVMGLSKEEVEEVFRIYGGQGRLWHTEFPKRRIFLDDYLIGKYEVLNRQYKIFVDETGHRSPRVNYDWGKPYNWVGNNYPEGMGDYPVVLVSWEDAEEYCRWAGLSLPTEAQWEKAARGIDGRKYPWGDKWDPARCNCAERLAGRNLESLSAWLSWWSSKGSEVVKTVQTQRAGCYCSGASPCGGLDMAGNAWEWCEDWYKAYPGNVCKCGKAGKSCKCSGFGEKFRACRGGSWYDDWSNCRTTFRFRFLPDFQSSCSGFRVCLMPEDRKSKSRKSGAP